MHQALRARIDVLDHIERHILRSGYGAAADIRRDDRHRLGRSTNPALARSPERSVATDRAGVGLQGRPPDAEPEEDAMHATSHPQRPEVDATRPSLVALEDPSRLDDHDIRTALKVARYARQTYPGPIG